MSYRYDSGDNEHNRVWQQWVVIYGHVTSQPLRWRANLYGWIPGPSGLGDVLV